MTSNVLNINKINELAEQSKSWKTATIRGNMKFDYRPVFSQEGKNRLLTNLQNFMSEASKNNILQPLVTDDKVFYLVCFFVVKEFTNILSEVDDSVEQLVSAFNNLVDTGIFDEIIGELPSSEVAGVLNAIFNYLKHTEDLLKNENDINKQLEELKIKHTNKEGQRKNGVLNAIL